MNTNNQDIINLVEVLSQLGLDRVVLSPGSRNAPLIKAFNQHPKIHCYSVVDERSAGFFGLGLAQQLQRPVAVVCTSGSALLNYGPAVVEAYHQQVPLLVISADRPVEWIGQGDGQAINQRNVFQNFSKGYFELKESRGHANSAWHNERVSAEAYHLSDFFPMGPVHLNVPLSEPLYGIQPMTPTLSGKATKGFQSTLTAPESAITELATAINTSQKVMVLIGQLHPNKEIAEAVHQLSKLEQVTILTETTSNLFGNGYIDQIDNTLATITEEEKVDFAPELLITFGGMVVTKRLKQFLRVHKATNHWHIDPSVCSPDTYQQLSHHLNALPAQTLNRLVTYTSNNFSDYNKRWITRKELSLERHKSFISNADYCDLTVFGQILNEIPDNSQLQIGNSSPVRYVQLFSNNPTVTHYCNRGVSGIDGCTSTAIGAAIGANKPTVLVSGEVSFLYDTNGLWNNATPSDFVGIVINNSGGSIFRIIEGPDQFSEMPEFIETTHNLSVKPLAEMHGFRYLRAENVEQLDERLKTAFKFDQKTIVEVVTPRMESPAILKQYWKFLKEGE